MSRRRCAVAVMCAAAILAAGCRGEAPSQQETAAPVAAPEPPPPLPGESTIRGVVRFEGTPPPAREIHMASDPLCMPEGPEGTRSEVVVVGPDNGLQYVFVYVKDGLGDRTFPPPKTPVVLDQKGCRYSPHVFGVQVGQPVEIRNSDPTLHNVHAIPKVNAEFNFGQPARVPPMTRVFDKPEIGVPFRCDVHGWMSAYAGVVPHPFYAVSGPDGSFEIKGLPAGTYTIEAWHEKLGTQTTTVTVDGKTGATASFTFKAT
ncbi:MAG TPA: carboxypeptidase regulatory-like domain-containing protein [Vicinamibacterales bacterium]|nr:carboxypeptidase regulatory-like domain-containing protein [Vicinamibacterales bacterium]